MEREELIMANAKAIILIAAIAVIALAGVGTGSYFFIKKSRRR